MRRMIPPSLALILLASTLAGADEEAPREGLVIPEAVWSKVASAVGRRSAHVGYTPDEMRHYGRDRHLLRPVLNLFGNARHIPRETGRWTDAILAGAADPAQVVYRGFILTDVAAGRNLPVPADEAWEADGPGDPAYAKLPGSLRRLIARLVRAGTEATPWLEGAVGARVASPDGAYALAAAPWRDEEYDQVATRSRASFDLLERTDRNHLAYAAVILLKRAHRAIEEYRADPADPAEVSSVEEIQFDTDLGGVRIFGPGDGAHEVPPGTFLTLDLGGNDRWSGHVGGTSPFEAPIALHLDLGGDDHYASEAPGSLACGVFGVGVLIDLAGDDRYASGESGLGCAWHGVGLLMDHAGNDVYRTKGAWGQGAAHVGVGALVDLAGDDRYECDEQSQGLGSTLGAGLLIDVEGNDQYRARDDGNVSKLYRDQSVAMSQGCGYGRRADLGDGHSLAGGVGLLLDGAGDDHYHAQVWAQGCGYWWGLGVLEDRGGNDTYENGKYSAGAGAHFAIGVCVDLAGNDRHNQGSTTAVNQYQGHARDGSIGVFFDGGGDDAYLFKNHCGGSADLCSIGLFFDRSGNDRYQWSPSALGKPNGWNDTGPMGTSTRYEPFLSFRDELPSWGIFLDTGGEDVYEALGEQEGIVLRAKDGRGWTHQSGPGFWGVGLDR